MTESARGTHCSSDGFDAFEIDRARPVPVTLHRGADNDRIGVLEHGCGISCSDTGTHDNGQLGRVTRGADIGGRGFTPGCLTGDDHRIRAAKFRRFDRFDQTHISGRRMGGMFLFHIRPNSDAVGADLPAVAQQGTGTCIHPSLVGNVSENKSLRADEIESGGERNGQSRLVGAGQNLHPAGQIGGVTDRAANGSHRSDDFRTHVALEVGNIVHVLDENGIATALGQRPYLLHCGAYQLLDRLGSAGRAGQRSDMDHADEGFVRWTVKLHPRIMTVCRACAKVFCAGQKHSMKRSDDEPAGTVCPFTGRKWPATGRAIRSGSPENTAGRTKAANDFLELFATEHGRPIDPARLATVEEEISRLGYYNQTREELDHACRVAWRNNRRCIGRRFWESLSVHDRRGVRSAGDIFDCCVEHLRWSTNGGRIRPLITVFAPEALGRPGPRIVNYQLVRYAGYRGSDGKVTGDPAEVAFTERAMALGWQPPAQRTPFDVLPLIIEEQPGEVRLFALPRDAVQEVVLEHPDISWFADLGLRWHALPAVSNMTLDAGGVTYPAAPFSGYYMETEIAARNLADLGRYNLLPVVADRIDPTLRAKDPFWRDRAVVELCTAVLYSFRRDGVTIVDHHAASRQFMEHLADEEAAGRSVPGDWSWLVPPVSGSTSPVFHQYYDPRPRLPDFKYRPQP